MKLYTAICWQDLKFFCRTLMGITCFDIIINLDSVFGLQKRNYGQVLIPVRLILWEVLCAQFVLYSTVCVLYATFIDDYAMTLYLFLLRSCVLLSSALLSSILLAVLLKRTEHLDIDDDVIPSTAGLSSSSSSTSVRDSAASTTDSDKLLLPTHALSTN